MIERRDYCYSGLWVETRIDIPDWAPFLVTPGSGQTQVRIEVAMADLAMPQQSAVLDNGKTVWIVVADVVAFKVTDGDHIIVYVASGSGVDRWLPMLTGTAWNALCLQRGLFLVHASVVCNAGGAMAFCGPSGAGKSSTAAALMARGLHLVSDDLCRISVARGSCVYPAAPRLRLWADAARSFGFDPAVLTRELGGRDKYFLKPLGQVDSSPVPLRVIFLLEWGEPALVKIDGLNALKSFVGAATFRPQLIEQMGLVAEHWAQCLRLLQQVPVFILRRPRDFTRLGEALALLG